MTATAPRRHRPVRVVRSQGEPLHKLRAVGPIPLERWRFVWWVEIVRLVGGVALVLLALYGLIWRVVPWQ